MQSALEGSTADPGNLGEPPSKSVEHEERGGLQRGLGGLGGTSWDVSGLCSSGTTVVLVTEKTGRKREAGKDRIGVSENKTADDSRVRE